MATNVGKIHGSRRASEEPDPISGATGRAPMECGYDLVGPVRKKGIVIFEGSAYTYLSFCVCVCVSLCM